MLWVIHKEKKVSIFWDNTIVDLATSYICSFFWLCKSTRKWKLYVFTIWSQMYQNKNELNAFFFEIMYLQSLTQRKIAKILQLRRIKRYFSNTKLTFNVPVHCILQKMKTFFFFGNTDWFFFSNLYLMSIKCL